MVAAYKGETGRNAYVRGKKHLAALRKKREDSVLRVHSLLHHQGQEDINFQMVAKQAYSEPLERPLREKINIRKFKGDILMNRKTEVGAAVVERESFKYWRGGCWRDKWKIKEMANFFVEHFVFAFVV